MPGASRGPGLRSAAIDGRHEQQNRSGPIEPSIEIEIRTIDGVEMSRRSRGTYFCLRLPRRSLILASSEVIRT